MVASLLNINPSQLEFLFEADRELKSALNIRNVHDDVRAAFKIKTTNTENFVVSPPFGIVEPGTTKLVKVYFKAHSAYTDDLRFCKDCFLVQSIVVEDEVTERDITSELFKSRQRQEARLKVLVAAPLAHGKVLEHEIKDIASNQGVEGHRAVVRKFAELLLARGIISQAQVALAFSTVGELFQDLQDYPKDSPVARFRKSSSQEFLEGRTGLMTEVSPSSSSVGLDEWNGVPLGRRYDSVKASTFRSVQPAEERGYSPLGPRDHAARPNGTSGESIINALTTGTETVGQPARSRGAGLRSIASAPDDRAYGPRFQAVAVDDKAEVSEGNPVPRQLSYDEAVNQAFPDDMFSQELANGIKPDPVPYTRPSPTAPAGPTAAAPMAREREPEFRPNLPENPSVLTPTRRITNPLFTASSQGLAEDEDVPLPSDFEANGGSQEDLEAKEEEDTSYPDATALPLGGREIPPGNASDTAAQPSEQHSPERRNLFAGDETVEESLAGEKAAGPSTPSQGASHAEPALQNPDTAATLDDEVGYEEESPERSPMGSPIRSPVGSPVRSPVASPTRSRGGSPQGRLQDGDGREERPQLRSTPEQKQQAEASPESAERQKSVGKFVRPAQGDTLGRTNVLLSIDRLATPAIRKPALPANKAGMSPERHIQSPMPRVTSPAKVQSPASRMGDKGHVFEPPDFSDLVVDVRDTDAERRAREGDDPTSPGVDVAIQPGNTLKMASFWGQREALA